MYRNHRHCPRGPSGFSLVELSIVVLIIGIVAAVAIPRYADSLAVYRVNSAAQRVMLDLQFARRRAKTASADQIVRFDPATDSYVLPGVPHLDHPGLDYEITLAEGLYGASIVSADFGGSAQLTYSGFGTPQAAGNVVVEVGRHQRTVAVDAATGEATIQ